MKLKKALLASITPIIIGFGFIGISQTAYPQVAHAKKTIKIYYGTTVKSIPLYKFNLKKNTITKLGYLKKNTHVYIAHNTQGAFWTVNTAKKYRNTKNTVYFTPGNNVSWFKKIRSYKVVL